MSKHPRDTTPIRAPLSVAEFSKRYGISKATTWRLIQRGDLRTVKPSPGRTIVPPEAERAYRARIGLSVDEVAA